MEKEATDNIKYVKKPKDRKSHSYASRHRQTLSGVEIKKKRERYSFNNLPNNLPFSHIIVIVIIIITTLLPKNTPLPLLQMLEAGSKVWGGGGG